MIWLIGYDIIYILGLICYLPIFLIKGRYHSGLPMRLGIFAPGVLKQIKRQKLIWLHAVSVGEAQAISFLVKSLQQEYPDYRLLISSVTKTGNKIAQGLLRPGDLAIYSPLDISWIVKKVINLLQPQLFIVAETEIWPNLIIHLAEHGVPIVLVNGRISDKSFKGYSLIRPGLKMVLQKFTLFCMQSEQDRQRIKSLGADGSRVKATGNMKFDLELEKRHYQKPDLGLTSNEPLLIAGSTHPGEEKILLQCFQKLVKQFTDLRLLIAPRHIQRAGQLQTLIGQFGFCSQRASQLNLEQRPDVLLKRPVLILDTVGQLSSLYALAEIVFVGGSLIAHGGQNPIEPAIWAKPILFGPHMHNFADITRLFLQEQAALMVRDLQELNLSCQRLLNQPSLAQDLGERAAKVVEQQRGASNRNLQLIKQILAQDLTPAQVEQRGS